jgi:hypothetical protein
MRARQAVAVVVMLVGVLASGCRVSTDNHDNSDNVKIATPFGGMSVKTNDAVVLEGIGLPAYPGAVLIKKDKKNGNHDDGAADVNLSFGGFQLRVKAAGYRSADKPDAVIAFYRKALGRYGDVIECQDNKPVGSLTHTAEGLTCDNSKENHLSVSTDDVTDGKDPARKIEMKAGSKLHQHIVSVDPDGDGTKFGLVALDLPGHFGSGSDDEEHKQ